MWTRLNPIYDAGVKSIKRKNLKHILKIPIKIIKLKFYHCLGNHDYVDIYNSKIIPKNKYQIEYTKISNKWVLPKDIIIIQKI